MKQPRRRAILLVALLVAASLVITPRVGNAYTNRTIDGLDPPPVSWFGDPGVPPYGPCYVVRGAWLVGIVSIHSVPVGIVIVRESQTVSRENQRQQKVVQGHNKR